VKFYSICVLFAGLSLFATLIPQPPVHDMPPPVVTEAPAAPTEKPEPEYRPPLPTMSPTEAPTSASAEDITALAQMVWGEARGLPQDEQRLCIWTVFNRIDAGFGETAYDVITAPGQFIGYDAEHPVEDEIYGLCEEELAKWLSGGEAPVVALYCEGTDYKFFEAERTADGRLHNFFRADWQ
jgi:hypothetical protein